MAFWIHLMIGSAAMQACPPSKGVLVIGGAWSATVCYVAVPPQLPRLVIA